MKIFYLLSLFILIFFHGYSQQDSLKTLDLDNVVISGQYRPQSLRNSVYQVRVINQEMIRANGATSVQQVLSAQLGFTFSQDHALGVSDVQLMGMGGRNVKILLDGVPLIDRGDIRESLGQVDINQLERIEIVEGPLSVIYGTDALAGVINLITKKPSRELTVNANFQEETVGDEYHPFSFRGLHQQGINLSTSLKNFQVSGGLAHYQFSGWGGDQYGRDKTWLPKEQWMGNVRLGYRKGNFSAYYRLDALDEVISDRGPINLNTFRSTDQRFFSDRYLHQLQGEWLLGNGVTWNSIQSFTDYKRRTKTVRHDFETGEETLTTGTGEQDVSGIQSFLSRNTVAWKISDKWTLQPGLEYQHEMANGERIAGSPSFDEISGFVTAEFTPKSWFKIRGGLRSAYHSVYKAPSLIPSLNVKVQAGNKLLLRASYAKGFRSPSLRELFFDFRDANHHIIGNQELEAETSESLTAGLVYDWLQKSTKLQTTVHGFYNRYHNLITFAQHPDDPQVFTTVNLDKFRTTGFSIENSFTRSNWVAHAGFSLLGRFNVYSADKNFESLDLPRFTWSPEANAGVIYSWTKPGIKFSLVYKFNGARPGYMLGANSQTGQEEVYQVRLSSYHSGDIFIRKTVFKKFELNAGVRNLFDVTTIDNTTIGSGVHGSQGPQSVGYGRSYSAGLSFQFRK